MSMIQALMGAGPLPLPKLPCAVCLALDVEPPDTATTLAGGSLACPGHVREALGIARLPRTTTQVEAVAAVRAAQLRGQLTGKADQ